MDQQTGSGQFLDALDEPHVIVTESTLESWDHSRRETIVRRARQAGHEILVFRPIHTARQRPADWDKSDVNDAKVIYRIAREGRLRLYPIPKPDPAWAERFYDINHQYALLRLQERKPELVAKAAATLGPYKNQSSDIQQALGNGKDYMPSVIAAAYHAAQHAPNRNTFERLLGLHGSGHPGILRSEVHHHGYRHLRKRGVTWSQYRRALRWAYQQFKAAQRSTNNT